MLASELKDKIKSLPPLPPTAPRFSWLRRRIELRKDILKKDVDNFLHWPTMIESMFVGNAPYTPIQYEQLTDRYKSVIIEPEVGNPQLFRIDGLATSGNLIHQAFSIMQFENEMGVRVEDLDSIVEFGGGYGAMALIVHRLGFEGLYIIQDFPEMILLQEWYLSQVLDDISNIDFLDELVVYEADLLIALCSLSEVSIGIRDDFFSSNSFRHMLILYQDNFYGIDNDEYFKDMGTIKKVGHYSSQRYCIC